jgi:predicted alpha/beta superfamily hydrolase
VFGFCGAMSPSLWFAGRAIFDVARAAPRWSGRVYLDIGTEEGRRHVRDTRQMCRLLRSRCPSPRDQLRCVVDEGAHHNEQAWAARFETAVRFLLPKQKGETNW